MTIICTFNLKECINIPNVHRYEDVKNMAVYSFQYYDTKGKGEDYRETIFCFDGKRIYFYENNDAVEESIEMTLKGYYWEDDHRVSVSNQVLDLSFFDATTTQRKIPKHYARAQKVV